MTNGGGVRYNGRTAKDRERETIEMMELRRTMSIQQIADRYGFSFNTVNDRLNAEMEKRGVENVALLREVQNAQINHLASKLAPKIDAGDTMAIGAAIRLLERSAKLNGLDAPLKGKIVGELEVSTINIIPDELSRKADDAATQRLRPAS